MISYNIGWYGKYLEVMKEIKDKKKSSIELSIDDKSKLADAHMNFCYTKSGEYQTRINSGNFQASDERKADWWMNKGLYYESLFERYENQINRKRLKEFFKAMTTNN